MGVAALKPERDREHLPIRGRHPTRMHSGVEFTGQDFTYVPIAKNGSSSILKTVWESDIPHERTVWCDSITTSTAVVMLREPTQRAWSAYLMMRRGPNLYDEGRPDRAWYPDCTLAWDAWLDVLVKERYHLQLSATMIPQTDYLCSAVRYEYIAWDFKAMAERLGIELPHINSAKERWRERGEPENTTPPIPDITPEMRHNLQIIYSSDYRLWELIT